MINLIVATDEEGMIAQNGTIPWRCKEDLKHFKETTNNHPMIMGRKTYESLPGILPNRQHIVVTKNKSLNLFDEIIICHSYEDAVERALQIDNNIFIIGGKQIYNLSLSSRRYFPHIIYKSVINTKIHQDETSLYFEVPNHYKKYLTTIFDSFKLEIYRHPDYNEALF